MAIRRLKCNRTNPCENCVRRGDGGGCTYAMPGTRKRSAQTQASSASPDDMQNRIDRLEKLVLSLMTNGSQSAGPAAAAAAISRTTTAEVSPLSQQPQNVDQEDNDMQKDDDDDSDVDSVANSFGILKVDNENRKSMYIGDSHWHLILSDVSQRTYEWSKWF